MSYQDFVLMKHMTLADCGAYADLCCYVDIKDRLNALRDELGGEHALIALLEYACSSCTPAVQVTTNPTPLTPVQPPVTVTVQPPVTRQQCSVAEPTEADFLVSYVGYNSGGMQGPNPENPPGGDTDPWPTDPGEGGGVPIGTEIDPETGLPIGQTVPIGAEIDPDTGLPVGGGGPVPIGQGIDPSTGQPADPFSSVGGDW